MENEEMTRNVRKYIALYNKSEDTVDETEQEKIMEKMEELYFELDSDEQALLESLGFC